MSAVTEQRRAKTVENAPEAVPPGYKRTEVGVIPEEWTTPRLGDDGIVQRVGSGITPTGGERVYKHSGHPFVRSQNVGWGQLLLDDLAFIDNPTHSSFLASEIREGDVLLNITGASIGRSAVATAELAGGNVNQHVCEIRTESRRLDPRFLCGFILSEPGQKQIDNFQAGGNRQGLNFGQIRAFLIPLPSPHEQRAIAEALSDVDGLLGVLEALIAKKRAIKQAAMQQLLTGKTRLPGFSGPWETKCLGEYVTYLRTGTNSRAELAIEGPTKYLHYGDIHTSTQVRLNPSIQDMPSLSEERARTLDRLRDGDLVFVDASEDLDGVGKSVEITGASDAEIVAGLHTIAARFSKSIFMDGFKAFLQFCPVFRQHLRRLAAGTKVYATNRGHISSAEVPLPSVVEQFAIATVLSDMDAEIAALERRHDKTRAIKQGMMQQLLTGRVRLVKPETDR